MNEKAYRIMQNLFRYSWLRIPCICFGCISVWKKWYIQRNKQHLRTN